MKKALCRSSHYERHIKFPNAQCCQVWGCAPVIPALGRTGQEDRLQYKTSVGYIHSKTQDPRLKKNKIKKPSVFKKVTDHPVL